MSKTGEKKGKKQCNYIIISKTKEKCRKRWEPSAEPTIISSLGHFGLSPKP